MLFKRVFQEIPFADIPSWDIIGKPEYLDSVYEGGIRHPVLVGEWKKKLYILDGRRRVASLKEAHKKAEEDGTLKDRPWLEVLPALVYQKMPPVDQAAWSILSNEERSPDDLQAYLIIQRYVDNHEWDKVNALVKLNKKRYEQIMAYAKLNPELMEMAKDNRISKGNAKQAAKLGERQIYLLELSKRKGENARITGKDIKAAKEARAGAALQTVIPSIVPRQTLVTPPKMEFLVMTEEGRKLVEEKGMIFTDFNAAFEQAQETHAHIFRMLKV